jgi:hypothetical protein
MKQWWKKWNLSPPDNTIYPFTVGLPINGANDLNYHEHHKIDLTKFAMREIWSWWKTHIRKQSQLQVYMKDKGIAKEIISAQDPVTHQQHFTQSDVTSKFSKLLSHRKIMKSLMIPTFSQKTHSWTFLEHKIVYLILDEALKFNSIFFLVEGIE